MMAGVDKQYQFRGVIGFWVPFTSAGSEWRCTMGLNVSGATARTAY
jgi:hypothetical protein